MIVNPIIWSTEGIEIKARAISLWMSKHDGIWRSLKCQNDFSRFIISMSRLSALIDVHEELECAQNVGFVKFNQISDSFETTKPRQWFPLGTYVKASRLVLAPHFYFSSYKFSSKAHPFWSRCLRVLRAPRKHTGFNLQAEQAGFLDLQQVSWRFSSCFVNLVSLSCSSCYGPKVKNFRGEFYVHRKQRWGSQEWHRWIHSTGEFKSRPLLGLSRTWSTPLVLDLKSILLVLSASNYFIPIGTWKGNWPLGLEVEVGTNPGPHFQFHI